MGMVVSDLLHTAPDSSHISPRISLTDRNPVYPTNESKGHGKAIRLGVYAYGAVTAWVDEVYVGPDTTRQFETPVVSGTGVEMERPAQTNGWSADDIGGPSTFHRMTRHESHLSRREYYQFDNTDINVSLFFVEKRA